MEEKEVVSDQFHLVQSVVDGHRLGRVILRADHASRAVVLVRLLAVQRNVRCDSERVCVDEEAVASATDTGRLSP